MSVKQTPARVYHYFNSFGVFLVSYYFKHRIVVYLLTCYDDHNPKLS